MRQIDDRNRARSGQVRGGGSRARDKWQEAVEHAVEHSSGVEIFVAFPNHFPVSDWLSFCGGVCGNPKNIRRKFPTSTLQTVICRHKKFGLHKMRGVKLLTFVER